MVGALMALLATHGAHWAALQTFAWSRMLVEFSQQGSLLSAVTQTFDGQHPCRLCSQVTEGAASEQKARTEKGAGYQARPLEALWELSVASIPPAPLSPALERTYMRPLLRGILDQPPAPPPRSRIA